MYSFTCWQSILLLSLPEQGGRVISSPLERGGRASLGPAPLPCAELWGAWERCRGHWMEPAAESQVQHRAQNSTVCYEKEALITLVGADTSLVWLKAIYSCGFTYPEKHYQTKFTPIKH